MSQLIFIGDIVDEAGLAYLERHLPRLIDQHQPQFVIANGENLNTSIDPRFPGAGMTPDRLRRLLALGMDLVTGGNHSWDGPNGLDIHDQVNVLRPLNYGAALPGRGAAIIEKHGIRLGVINVVSRTALPEADSALDAIELQLADWEGKVDAVLVDYHGGSVTEKLTAAFAFDGRVTALLGTHTHVRTLDTRLLPHGTAYCTDVGMTGPGGGIQGYQPAVFVNSARLRRRSADEFGPATGAVELGAVRVTFEGLRATAIERLMEAEHG